MAGVCAITTYGRNRMIITAFLVEEIGHGKNEENKECHAAVQCWKFKWWHYECTTTLITKNSWERWQLGYITNKRIHISTLRSFVPVLSVYVRNFINPITIVSVQNAISDFWPNFMWVSPFLQYNDNATLCYIKKAVALLNLFNLLCMSKVSYPTEYAHCTATQFKFDQNNWLRLPYKFHHCFS